MARTEQLPTRVAVNVRAEMAARRFTSVQLAQILNIGHRAALRRVNGEQDFTLSELERTAAWLTVSVAYLMRPREVDAQAVAS